VAGNLFHENIVTFYCCLDCWNLKRPSENRRRQ
jgi:hypothetical protein